MALSVPEALEQRAEPSTPWGGRAKQETLRLIHNGGQRRGRGRVSLTCLLSREHTFSAPSSPASAGIKPGSRTGQQGLACSRGWVVWEDRAGVQGPLGRRWLSWKAALAAFIFRSVGGHPLCALSQVPGPSSKPPNPTSTGFLLPAVSLIGGRISAPDLEKKLAGQSPLRRQPARPLRSRYAQALRPKGAQAPGEGPADACQCPGHSGQMLL